MRSKRHAYLRRANANRHQESISTKTPLRSTYLESCPTRRYHVHLHALVAQPDRASDYESEGRRFESCRARPSNSSICRSFCRSSAFSITNSSGFDGSMIRVRSIFRSEKALRGPVRNRFRNAVCVPMSHASWATPSYHALTERLNETPLRVEADDHGAPGTEVSWPYSSLTTDRLSSRVRYR